MRRPRARRYHPLFHSVLIIILMIMVISVGYSYLTMTLSIKGNVHGVNTNLNYIITPDSNPNLKINASLSSTWIENGKNRYQYLFTITNIGTVTLDNFKITVTFKNNIESPTVWNYDYTLSGKVLTIINTNYLLAPNSSQNISFAVSSNTPNLKIYSIKLESTTTTSEVTLDQFNVNFNITDSWGNYTYQYDATVTNKTGNKITYWQLDITLPSGTTYISGWNGVFSVSNNVLTIKNTDYNGVLNNGASTTFGMQLNTNIINFIPSNIKITVR